MIFAINHARAVTGNDIYVKVEADASKALSSVRTVLDDFTLADDGLTADSASYERTFPAVGDAGPGTQHSLVVTAQQADGSSHSSTSIWTDPF